MLETQMSRAGVVGRPEPSEHAQYYGRYIALVPDGDIVAALERQGVEITALLRAYTAERASWRPAPGEWNAIEIVGHLADTERIFAYRALRIARKDQTPIEGIDDVDAYVAAADLDTRTLDAVAAELAVVRQATLVLLRSFDDAAWTRLGTADGNPVGVRALAYTIAGHELHHLADLQRYSAGE